MTPLSGAATAFAPSCTAPFWRSGATSRQRIPWRWPPYAATSGKQAPASLLHGVPALDFVQQRFHLVLALKNAELVFERFRIQYFRGRGIFSRMHMNFGPHPVDGALVAVAGG